MSELWKATERAICKRLGARRVPVTGRQRGDAPDGEHSWLSIEIKHRKSFPLWLHDAMAQAAASVRDEQLPVVVLHQFYRRHDDDFVVLRLRDFVDWFVGEEALPETMTNAAGGEDFVVEDEI